MLDDTDRKIPGTCFNVLLVTEKDLCNFLTLKGFVNFAV